MTDKRVDREALLAEIEAGLGRLPLDVLRRFKRVVTDVAKGTAVDAEAMLDQEPETDQERGERLGTRFGGEPPFGKASGGGLYRPDKVGSFSDDDD